MIEATTRPPDGKDAHSHPERSHSAQKSLAIALRQSKNSIPPATKSAPQRLFPQPARRAKESGIPAVNSPVLFDYSEQLAILLFGQLMKWLRPLVRRGDSIPWPT